MTEKMIHEGRNVKRFRELLGMKQEALADALGDDWNQKKISLLEAKETIEPAMLEQVAKALNVPAKAIKDFDEETAIYNIQNNYEGANPNAKVDNGANYHHCNFNLMDKLVEYIEEIKRLNADLLKEKDEKIALLEKMMDKK